MIIPDFPAPAPGTPQSALAAHIAALQEAQSLPHPDTGQPCPPPYRKPRATIRGGVRKAVQHAD